MGSSLPAWEVRRSVINHDWLKNVFLADVLETFILLVERGDAHEKQVKQFFELDLIKWDEYYPIIKKLLEDYEKEMSPRTLFEALPLDQCDSDTKQWLGDMVHKLWIFRHDVKARIENGTAALEKADFQHRALLQKYKESDKGNNNWLKNLLPELYRFRDSCNDLKNALTALQQRGVMVI